MGIQNQQQPNGTIEKRKVEVLSEHVG